MFNGDVLTQVDLGAVIALHRERRAKATIVLTPVDNPRAYGLVETDANSNIRRFLEKPEEDQITCDTINAGIYILEPDTFDRIPADTPWSIERSFFPSLIERGETFVAYVYRGYWIDIGTPEKYVQVHRDIMDGRYQAAPFAGTNSGICVAPTARVEDGARLEAPVLHRRGHRRQGRRDASARTASSAGTATSKSTRRSMVRSSGPTRASARRPSSASPFWAATATSAATRPSANIVLGDKSADHRLQPAPV